MGKDGKYYTGSVQMKKIFLLFFLFITSCSFPKIIVYDDPLTEIQHNDLGVVYYKKGQYDLAEKEFLKAIERKKDWYLPYFNLGNLYYKKGDTDKAIKYFEKSLNLEKKDETLNNLAYIYIERRDCEKAKFYISQIKDIQSNESFLDTFNKFKEICK